jgi:hypothetical protein
LQPNILISSHEQKTAGGLMRKILIVAIAIALCVPFIVKGDVKLWGELDVDVSKEVTENTDLIEYVLSKQNVTREDTHVTRYTIDAICARSAPVALAPHFKECWDKPYYFPRWARRVLYGTKASWSYPDGIYQMNIFGQVRTGFLTIAFPNYMPVMDIDPKKPLEKAFDELYKNEWGFQENTKIVIDAEKINVNGKTESSVKGDVINNVLFVSPKYISVFYSVETKWEVGKKRYTIIFDKKTIELTVGSDKAVLNGKAYTIPKPFISKEGRLLVPIFEVIKIMGIGVNLVDAKTKMTFELPPNLGSVKKANLEAIKGVPLKVQSLMADFLLQINRTAKYNRRALRKLAQFRWEDLIKIGRYLQLADKDYQDEAFYKYLISTMPEDDAELMYDLATDYDFNNLYYGTAPMLVKMCEVRDFLADPRDFSTGKDEKGKPIPGPKIDLSKVKFELTLPLGKFAFNGSNEVNNYKGEDYYCIIDVGGDDTYTGPAAAAWTTKRPVSVIFDWAGNDRYTSTKDDVCSQGSGMLGSGILWDHSGNDTYVAYDNAQGHCFFGVGQLWDEGGNDTFKARNMAQGAACFGIGQLVNIGGNDSYYAFMCAQGFGFQGGSGTLLDTEGDDKYVGETGKSNPKDNLTTPGVGGHDNDRNYCFVQGAGWGRRSDMGDGHGMGGGVGILQDLKGNDWYECGVYGQATGYWFGTGILHDAEGDDHYEGSFFVQSGTAHMGLTAFFDDAGNDSYTVWKAISQGGAHDFSVSWFIDKAGNDKYYFGEPMPTADGKMVRQSGGILVGSAITNSIAVHIDYAGDDVYDFVTSSTCGYCMQRTGPKPDNYRYEEWTAGIYINRGGNDTYLRVEEPNIGEGWPKLKNNAMWKEVQEPGNHQRSLGFGLDCETGIVPEAEW